MIEQSAGARGVRIGRRAGACLLLLLVAAACGGESPAQRAPPPRDPRGGRLVLQTRGRGYVALDGAYTGGCRNTCELTIPLGRTVTMMPAPNSCFQFVGWTGACAGQLVCTLSSGGEATALFTAEPDGGDWLGRPGPSPAPPPPFEAPGYAIAEVTWSSHGDFGPRALDEDGNVLGGVGGCGARPARYDSASGSVSVLTPLTDDDVVAIASASDGTILVTDTVRSYRWKNDALEPLGSLGSHRTNATAMNAAGWVVGSSALADGTPHAFVDDGASMTDLGEAFGDWMSFAYAINARGEIVGIAGQTAAVFGPETKLLPIPSRSVALDVSDTGIVVGTAGQGLEQKWPPTAFVYDLRTDTLTTVLPVPGDLTVTLYRVNRSGTIVLGSGGNQFRQRSFVWKDGRLHDLATYLGVRNTPSIFTGVDVNDRGQFLVLTGEPGELGRYFVLTPP